MITVTGPDGVEHDFPDGTSPDVIKRTLARVYGTQPPATAMDLMQQSGLAGAQDTGGVPNVADPVAGDPTNSNGDALVAGLNGFTYGASNELLSRAVAGAFPNRTEQGLLSQQMSEGIDQYRADNPLAAYGAEIGGALLQPATYLGGGAGNLATRIATNMGMGGLLSGFYGFNEGQGSASERIDGAIPAAGWGAGIGAAIPLVGAVGQRAINGILGSRAIKEASQNAPSMDELRAMATDLYSKADQAAPMPRTGLAPLAQRILDDPANINLDEMLVPNAARVANNIADAATVPTPTIGYRELDILRRQASVPAGDIANPTQSAIGTRMIEGLDQFIAQSDPGMSEAVTAARSMWTRLRKSEVIEQAIERARNQASGFENGIRVQFRAILNNPSRLRGFTDQEISAMQAVVRGTPMGNLMRTIGKLGIDAGQNTNAVGATIGAVTGGALGGPVGAIALPAIASVMRAGAKQTTTNAADRVQGLLASGGLPALPQISQETRLLLERMMGAQAPVTGLLAGPQ